MARVLWAREALRNLSSIGDYLDEVAPQKRAQVLSALVDATDVLTRFPRIGRAVPEIADPSFRELIVDRHRVIYEIKEDTVTVLSIFDAAMDARARLRILLRDND